MTRIDIVSEEESYSDNSSTASCNTTDEVESAIESENGLDLSLRKFLEERSQNEAAQDYYRYCRYYHQYFTQAEDDDDDQVEQDRTTNELREIEQREFRQRLVATVLSYIFKLSDRSPPRDSPSDDSMNENQELRPKFAVIKHNPQPLGSLNSDTPGPSVKRTPDWYFNIPDTLTPFPEMGSTSSDSS